MTWSSWLNQPTAQIYHLSVDYRFPYWVTGAQQDSGAVAVRSRGKFAKISMRDWEPIGAGGESGMTAGDPLHPGIIFGGAGTRFDLETEPAAADGTQPASPEPARTDWTQPLVFSKADPHALYYANQFLFKTTDGAQTWTQISPDLTRPDPGIPANLDAVAARDTDRNGKRGVIYTVAPVAAQRAAWSGSAPTTASIQVTTDDGKTWQNVTPPALTSWSRVTTIEASHFDANEAYASVDRHQLGDFNPHIYRTRDLGKTWQEITHGLPAAASTSHVVKEDPARRGLLFAGTERARVRLVRRRGQLAVAAAEPAGDVGARLRDLRQRSRSSARTAAGFWVIDDISPLRQINDAVARADAYLFKPADADQRAAGRRQRHADAEGRAAGGEPAERRGDRLLPEDRGDRAGHDRDSGCRRRVRRPVHERSGVGAGVRRGGGGRRRRVRSRRRRRHPEHVGAVASAPEPLATGAGMHRDYLGARRWRRSWRTRRAWPRRRPARSRRS